jgi:hypothetical protein
LSFLLAENIARKASSDSSAAYAVSFILPRTLLPDGKAREYAARAGRSFTNSVYLFLYSYEGASSVSVKTSDLSTSSSCLLEFTHLLL